MSNPPGTAEEVANLLQAARDADDGEAFFSALRENAAVVRADLSLLTMASRLAEPLLTLPEPPGFRHLNLRVLRNATLEPWLPHVFVALVERAFIPSLSLGDFDVYEAYAFESTEDDGFDGLTLVFWDSDRLIGDSGFTSTERDYEVLRDRLENVLRALALRGPTAVCTLAPPSVDPSRVVTSHDEWSWERTRGRLNEDLLRWASEESSVVVLDLAREVARFGAGRYRDSRTHYAYQVPFGPEFMPVAADALAGLVSAVLGTPRKCVVVDCDNTLWGGVLGEDGPDGVAIGGEYPGNLYREFQLFLRSLGGRGILLALNSKNNERDVLEFMADSPNMILREEHVAAHRINWRDKAGNLSELAEELNIGLDSIVFIDDSPVECALVSSLLPEVQVERFPEDPLAIPDFISNLRGLEMVRVTADDLKRLASIRANGQREVLRRSSGDLREFLETLDIRLVVRRGTSDQVARVSQLTQRTNQFNLTTRRYTTSEVAEFVDSERVYTMSMEDRFSDYGTVAACILLDRGDGGVVFDTLLLSCRAFGRHVEDSFLLVVLRDLAARGFAWVEGEYRPTEKNAMVEDFFPGRGFEEVRVDGTSHFFRLDLSAGSPQSDVFSHGIQTEGF